MTWCHKFTAFAMDNPVDEAIAIDKNLHELNGKPYRTACIVHKKFQGKIDAT